MIVVEPQLIDVDNGNVQFQCPTIGEMVPELVMKDGRLRSFTCALQKGTSCKLRNEGYCCCPVAGDSSSLTDGMSGSEGAMVSSGTM